MHTSVDLAACRGCHCLAARRHARALTRLFEEKLRPHGLRATQFSILAALALKGPTPVTELAETLGLERTTLTRTGALLERHGWVSTARSKDARKRPFRLTGAGRRKLEGAFPAWKEAQDLVDRRLVRRRRQSGSDPRKYVEPDGAVTTNAPLDAQGMDHGLPGTGRPRRLKARDRQANRAGRDGPHGYDRELEYAAGATRGPIAPAVEKRPARPARSAGRGER